MVFIRLILCKPSYIPSKIISIFCRTSYRTEVSEDAALSVDTFIWIRVTYRSHI